MAGKNLTEANLRLTELRAEKTETVTKRCIRIIIVKKNVLSLVTGVALSMVVIFGFTGCGSDDEVKTQVRNAALSPDKSASFESKESMGERVNRQLGEVLATLRALSPDELSELIKADAIDMKLFTALNDLNGQMLASLGKPAAIPEKPPVATDGEPCNQSNRYNWDCATFIRCVRANSRDERRAVAERYGVDIDDCDFE
jgi:hypothetical protein|tara:strand:- start:1108 stop:1707 length:600 start_codon:yes stop_codon:yes gene_type:complete